MKNSKFAVGGGIAAPNNWAEMIAAAPALKEKGIIPLSLAEGWPVGLLTENLIIATAGVANYVAVYQDRNLELARGPEFAAVFQAIDEARQIADPKATVPQWNDAVALVIQGKAAANVMGDWAGSEFAVAGMVAGVDFDCLPGLGVEPVLGTGGDVFYFPKSDDPEVAKAQLAMAIDDGDQGSSGRLQPEEGLAADAL